jgi:polysaccharide pyruvyl transferase WcaK-like protein
MNIYYFLVGNYGNYNIGDEMILKQIVREFTLKSDDALFYVPTRHPDFVKVYHDELGTRIFPISTSEYISIAKHFLKSDNILIGGGGIWSRYTGRFAHLIPFLAILGRIIGKNVAFNSIGIYKTASNLDKLLVNLGILFSNSCSVRDQESFDLLWSVNRSKSKIVKDLAMTYLEYLKEKSAEYLKIPEHDEIEMNKKNGHIVIGISPKATYNIAVTRAIVEGISSAINTLNSHNNNYVFVFFPFAKTESAVEDDYELTRQILNNLNKRCNVKVITHSNPIGWYYAIDKLVDTFIGMRYHSIMFAIHSDKNVLCLPYENKIFQLLNSSDSRKRKHRIEVMLLDKISPAGIVNFIDRSLV